ncbi:hypothetical protein ALC60_04579 [Trachymyrmex zeteki]|uniref:Uncharacterized protein n=1 Tax=Mycetomoellerius zeteki TaxID=64791 RepID=A0A151X806_9HYME|nr:hypothetical protein ALC60_04579 [Trachymyrmex zeteki]
MLIFFNTIIIKFSFEVLEGFLSKTESKLITFVPKNPSELWRSAKKHCNFSFLLILELFEYLVPIGTTCILGGISLAQENEHFGQVCLAFQYRCIIDCNIEAKGVTPIPVAIKTACCARKM